MFLLLYNKLAIGFNFVFPSLAIFDDCISENLLNTWLVEHIFPDNCPLFDGFYPFLQNFNFLCLTMLVCDDGIMFLNTSKHAVVIWSSGW